MYSNTAHTCKLTGYVTHATFSFIVQLMFSSATSHRLPVWILLAARRTFKNMLWIEPYNWQIKTFDEQYRKTADKILDRFFDISYFYAATILLQNIWRILLHCQWWDTKGLKSASHRPPSDRKVLGTGPTRTGRHITNTRHFYHKIKQVGYKLWLSELRM